MRKLSFRQRQFLILLVIVITPLTIAMILSMVAGRNFVIERATRQLETVATLKAIQVRQLINEGREVAQSVASLPELSVDKPWSLSPANAQIQAAIEVLNNIFLEVQSISLLDPEEGRVLLSTDPTQPGRVRRNEEYFQAGQQALFVGAVRYSVGRETPILIISAPVRGKSGSLLSVAAIELSASSMEVVMGNRVGLGQTGRAYLVEAFGFYVTQPYDMVGGALRNVARSEGVTRALAGQNGSAVYLNPLGVSVLGVYRWLPEVKMGLLVEIEEAELTAEIERLWAVVALMSLGLLALVVPVARALAGWLVMPLERIVESVRRLQAGDLEQRASHGGPDEIRQLASAFNAMADSVQRSHAELEHLVVERTTELQTANKRLQQEVAERRRAEEQISVALKEKELLLKEIHHRVKNNLQVVHSLLDMQSYHVTDEQAIEALNQSKNRIQSMAFIHEQLYMSTDFTNIDFAAYLEDLTGLLLQVYDVNLEVIDLQINARECVLGIDIAIPCGLLIHELASNSLQHAFPNGGTGEIRIDLRQNNGEYTLTVADNGVGIPPSVDFRDTESLGLELVVTLAEQLDGVIDLDRSAGTEFTIQFPVSS